MKRIAAISFSLLAYIVLLAHVVIPHHHHDDEVCIVNTHCDNDHETHQHKESNNSHEHHGHSHYEYCVIDQIVVLPTSNERPEFKALTFTPKANDFHVNVSSLSGKYSDTDLLCSINRHTQNKIPSYHSQTVKSSHQLRGPPTV